MNSNHRIGEKYDNRSCIDCGLINDELSDDKCAPLDIPLAKRIDLIERELLIRYLMKKMRYLEKQLGHCAALKSPDQRRREVAELYQEVININAEYKDKEILPLANFRKGFEGVKNEQERIEEVQRVVREKEETNGGEGKGFESQNNKES